LVERNPEVADAVRFRGRKMPGADVHLERRQDQDRGVQLGGAQAPAGDELAFADAVAHPLVECALLLDRGLPFRLASTRPVVMAHEQPCLWWHRQDALDRAVKLLRISAGE